MRDQITIQDGDRLTREEAAEYLRVSPRTLDRWHEERVGPPRIKIGRHIEYRRTMLDAWILQHEENPVRNRQGHGK